MYKHRDYPHLSRLFLSAMEEIGVYGEEKYGDKSFIRAPIRTDRTNTNSNGKHILAHYSEYALAIKHDHFDTYRHQLAAVAFNAMMEFILAGLEDER
jgi:hypothetical protein